MAERKRAGAEVNSFCAFLLMEGAVDDLLKQSALAYRALLPYRYHFALGWKGQLSHISICFPECAYHHLAGFHKVGIEALQNKKWALRTIISGSVTHVHFQGAGAALEDRWEGICRLKDIIENNRGVFRYRKHEQPGSSIKGDYLMMDETTAFFIVEDTPESIFSHRGRHFGKGCPRMTTLQIVREEVASGERELIFQASSFRE